MSVSRMCDEGLKCLFDKDKAQVLDQNGVVLCEFERQGGLYVGMLKLKCPKKPSPEPGNDSSFPGPGR